MSRYNKEDFYNSDGSSVRRTPDAYEDISSDYTPEEKTRYTQRSRADFTVNRPAPPMANRKFYDDTLLSQNRGEDAGRRQQELDERRYAREAQERVRQQVSSRQYQDIYSGYVEEDDEAQPYQSSYAQSRGYYENRRQMEDTLEGIPLSAGYDSYGSGSGRPPRGGNGRGSGPDGQGPRKKKKRHILRTLLIVLLVLILAGGGTIYGVMRHALSGLNQTEISDIDKLGISDAINQKYGSQNIINFALFGLDTHEDDEMAGRSDSIMIISVNRSNGAVKIISILRDSLVSIQGHGKEKITHAYSYGGPELAINTINQNFDMNIQDYATVNFAKMAEIIDTLGGLDLEITEFELDLTNGIGQSTYGKKNFEDLEHSGQVHMNGKQAVSFARIRTDSDNARAERQRKVISLLIDKIKQTSVLKYPSLLKQLLGYVETSMTYDEILGFAPMALKNITIQQTAVPDEEQDGASGGYYNDLWVWKFDKTKASDRIHQFIYET